MHLFRDSPLNILYTELGLYIHVTNCYPVFLPSERDIEGNGLCGAYVPIITGVYEYLSIIAKLTASGWHIIFWPPSYYGEEGMFNINLQFKEMKEPEISVHLGSDDF